MRRLVGLSVLLVLGLVTGCGGGDDDDSGEGGDSMTFAVETANASAHAAMLETQDLPGTGWEVTATDEFDDSGDVEAAMENEPACATVMALSGLGGIFGDSEDEDLPAGRAKVEFANATLDQTLPTSIELEVEIEETVAEIQGGWGLAKEVIESDDFGNCMVSVLPTLFAQEDMPEGVEVDVSTREPSVGAPNDGAAMAFDMNVTIGAIELPMAIELYMWPYGNAGVTATFAGTQEALDEELIGSTLNAFEQNVSEAAS